VTAVVVVCGQPNVVLDVDECSELTGACGPVGRCENVAGSYRCSCPPGYQLDDTGRRCVDTDECRPDPDSSTTSRCQFGCVNLVGGFRCECPVGFVHYFYWNHCVGTMQQLRLAFLGPFYGAIAVPSVTRCRCCRRRCCCC